MGKKVLVVDDERLIVKGIKFSLVQDDMEVDCAYDGEEALEMAKKTEYDIVLLDVMLPKMDGFEVCQHTACPTLCDVRHTDGCHLFGNNFLGLFLGRYEQHAATALGDLLECVCRLIELQHGLVQVDDVDAVLLHEDVRSHFGVPFALQVTEVRTGFQ